jgi:hypothetical protein
MNGPLDRRVAKLERATGASDVDYVIVTGVHRSPEWEAQHGGSAHDGENAPPKPGAIVTGLVRSPAGEPVATSCSYS